MRTTDLVKRRLEYFIVKGSAYLLTGAYFKAIENFNNALQTFPECLSYQFNLAIAYYLTGNLEDASKIMGSLYSKVSNSSTLLNYLMILAY